jgi:hypothetical protein
MLALRLTGKWRPILHSLALVHSHICPPLRFAPCEHLAHYLTYADLLLASATHPL